MLTHELYRAEFPDGTAYIGYTSIGIDKRWAGEHNSAVQLRKARYPKVRPVRVMTCFTERVAKRVEANLISSEARIVLNQLHTNGNSIRDREVPPVVPDDADGLACDLEKLPTIEMADGTKHPNPLYKSYLLGREVRLILNQLRKIRGPEARPAVPDDADGLACDLEKAPTIEMTDGTKHPNPLYKDLFRDAARVLKQLSANGNPIRAQEVPSAVPADADGIACDLEKIPTIEMSDGTKHPNPLYKAKGINWDRPLKSAGSAALVLLGISKTPIEESD